MNAPEIDIDPAACRRLWAEVLAVAIEDALRDGDASWFWSDDAATILDLLGIAHERFRSRLPVLMAHGFHRPRGRVEHATLEGRPRGPYRRAGRDPPPTASTSSPESHTQHMEGHRT